MHEDQQLGQLTPVKTHFETIDTALIDDPERPMRTDLSQESIGDLVSSIKQVGIIEPIVVKPVGDRYEVVAGHRRITAAEAAGLLTVPCHVVEGTEEQVEMMKIHENLYRVDVNPYDEAQHYARLIKEMKLSPMTIARITNRGETYVRARLAILEYDEVLRNAIAEGKLNLGVAKELNRLKDPAKLREMSGYAIGHGITQGVARKWVDEQMPSPQSDPSTTSFIGEQGTIVPASEQHIDCFYCMQPVRLFDAYTVYVHDHCVSDRAAAGVTNAEEDPNAA